MDDEFPIPFILGVRIRKGTQDFIISSGIGSVFSCLGKVLKQKAIWSGYRS